MQLLRVLLVAGIAVAPACAADATSDEAEDDLTSLTARSRDLTFDAYVYVAEGASDDVILAAVRGSTQTAFGALRTAQVAVNSRELKDVNPATFKKTPVKVVDPRVPGDPGKGMVRVAYRYTDRSVVPVSMKERTSLPSAVMTGGYRTEQRLILEQCSANDAEAQSMSSMLWYVFNPSLAACQKQIQAERAKIDADQASVGPDAVPLSEAQRLFIPTTVSLGADRTKRGETYPEYDRLYAGGVRSDALVVGLVYGTLDHGGADETQDSGFNEFADTLRQAFKGHNFGLVKSEPSEDFGSVTLASGKNVSFQGVPAWVDWKHGVGFPVGLSLDEKKELLTTVSKRILRHWLTFEAPITVQTGTSPARNVTLTIQAYFGAGTSAEPHKRGIKTSDVFLYNGHSYIGYGPLDPSNFTASDFPSTYQLLFIDGCVSYNYYEKDYIPLKAGKTKALDLITNGMETPQLRSGEALGKFVAALLDGKQESYRALLSAASDTDQLRVVDGELDNRYRPVKTPIVVTNR
ncbi:MAG: hypothetical protein HOO96_32105 [Polyangiaceae bacterium]|nr:hypothetical protein [Polyangiaceae bacterium]